MDAKPSPLQHKGFFARTYYAIYNTTLLDIYDVLILRLNGTFAWRCPTKTVLLPLFSAHFSKNHLDIGVGSGFFPSTVLARIAHEQAASGSGLEGTGGTLLSTREETPHGAVVRFHESQAEKTPQRVTLYDLSTKALNMTEARIKRCSPTTEVSRVEGDATTPQPALEGVRFDSVSAFYLLHCLPQPTDQKARGLFGNIRTLLSETGVLVGSTVLGSVTRKTSTPAGRMDWMAGPQLQDGMDGRAREKRESKEMNLLARFLMGSYNRSNIFSNWADEPDIIVEELERHFEEVETWIVGRVLMFRARRPRAYDGDAGGLMHD